MGKPGTKSTQSSALSFSSQGSIIYPLVRYFENNIWTEITAIDITKATRTKIIAHGSQFGLTQSDISARSMRAGGAMALLLVGVSGDTIKLLG